MRRLEGRSLLYGGRPTEAALRALDREARTIRRSEGGRVFVGMIVTRCPWITWERSTARCACDRCGASKATPVVPDVLSEDLLKVMANHLTPFMRDHQGCQRSDQ